MATVGDDATADGLVQDFLSGDKHRILEATWKVIGTRDPAVLAGPAAVLPRLRAATDEVDLGGALGANSMNLEHAFYRLDLFRRGVCLCAAYLEDERGVSHLGYRVKREEDRGHVRIVGEAPSRQWEPLRICACTDCGRRFEVEEGDYHYPWWQWRALPVIPE